MLACRGRGSRGRREWNRRVGSAVCREEGKDIRFRRRRRVRERGPSGR